MLASLSHMRFILILLAGLASELALAEGRVYEVIIPDGQNVFVPDTLTIAVGDTVRWINKDATMASHDFASVPGPGPESKEIKIIELRPGQSAEHRFNTPGTYRYFCYVHKDMTGTIIVK